MTEQSESTTARSHDAGIGLVELLIYAMLLAIVSSIAGSLLITGLTSQRDITAMGSATSRAQVVVASIEDGVRTASSVSVPTASAVGQRLVTRTGTFTTAGVATWECRSWLIAPTGNVYYRSAQTAIAAPNNLSAASLAGWSLLTEGVTAAPGSTAPFAVSGNTLSVSIQVSAGSDGAPALVNNRISKQSLPTTSGTGPSTC
ncbi:hypothetical protein HDC94_000778 [Leifsonia sp. AK011]|uniref:PulJ/GspJ family protein n=1 Tax=Leifsonia sp. AK011 TaxID=2723075 RepID=UPI0015CC9BD9|nr:hypothetical protein [Leifsonia sp. AK011]NYF09622.1 hypothetical protein [Leifsonia sp. AK011]